MAAELELPHSTVTSAIKALRADRVLNIKGRGTSAARMTSEDAAAILVAIMTAAVSAEMPKITRTLLQMPCRVFMRDGRIAGPDHSGRGLGHRPHLFIDELRNLFPETVSPHAASDWSVTGGAGISFGEGDEATVAVGLDGYKREGFAVLEIAASGGRHVKNFYSTCELREGKPDEGDGIGLGLGFYRKAPPFVFSATASGRALFAIGEFLAGDSETTSTLP